MMCAVESLENAHHGMGELALGSQLVFIVGCPRSGTTYLQRLLASHHRTATGQESNVLRYVGPLLRRWKAEGRLRDGRGGVGLGCYFTDDKFRGVVRDFLNALLAPMTAELQPGTLFIEKTPHHAVFLSELNELLPEARIIHMLRDPRDVVASLVAASRSWGRGWAPRTALRASLWWRRSVQATKDAQKTIPANRFLEVRYEDLVTSPVGVMRSLLAFLQLPWDEAEMKEAIHRNSIESTRNGEATPIPKSGKFAELSGATVVEPEGFVRSGVAGGWKKQLWFHQRVSVWLITRHLAADVGYH